MAQPQASVDDRTKIRVYLLLLMALQQNDIALIPLILKRLKTLLTGDGSETSEANKEKNTSFFVAECQEGLCLLALLLLMSAASLSNDNQQLEVYVEIT